MTQAEIDFLDHLLGLRTNSEQEQLERAVVVLNGKLFGILLGFLLGGLLFLATNVLILTGRGGHVGSHFALIPVFFPGYGVTFIGSIVGFFYMFLLGCIAGVVTGLVYNKIARATAYNPTASRHNSTLRRITNEEPYLSSQGSSA